MKEAFSRQSGKGHLDIPRFFCGVCQPQDLREAACSCPFFESTQWAATFMASNIKQVGLFSSERRHLPDSVYARKGTERSNKDVLLEQKELFSGLVPEPEVAIFFHPWAPVLLTAGNSSSCMTFRTLETQ